MPSELNQKKASICRDPPGNVSLGLYVEGTAMLHTRISHYSAESNQQAKCCCWESFSISILVLYVVHPK